MVELEAGIEREDVLLGAAQRELKEVQAHIREEEEKLTQVSGGAGRKGACIRQGSGQQKRGLEEVLAHVGRRR